MSMFGAGHCQRRARTALAWMSALVALGCGAHSPRETSEPEHLALVSQAASNTVAAVNPKTGSAEARIQVGSLPHRFALTADQKKAYVVLVGSQAVAEIDTTQLTLERTFLTAPVPETREDGSRITEHFDEDAFSATSCFECHSPGGAKPFVVGERPFGIALSEDESTLYVAHVNSARLSVIDRASGELLRSVTLEPAGKATEIAELTRLGDKLALSLRAQQPSTEPGVLRFIDPETLTPLGEDVPVGADPVAVTALPARDSVLVSNFDSNTLSEISLSGLEGHFTVSPGPLGTRLLGQEERLLVLDYYSNAISHVDLGSGKVETAPLEFAGRGLANPTHCALSPSGRLAYVVASGTDGKLAAYDLSARRVVRTMPIEGLSFDVVVVPKE